MMHTLSSASLCRCHVCSLSKVQMDSPSPQKKASVYGYIVKVLHSPYYIVYSTQYIHILYLHTAIYFASVVTCFPFSIFQPHDTPSKFPPVPR